MYKLITITILLAMLSGCASNRMNSCPAYPKKFKPMGGARTRL